MSTKTSEKEIGIDAAIEIGQLVDRIEAIDESALDVEQKEKIDQARCALQDTAIDLWAGGR